MSNEMMSRQESLQLELPKSVAVVGCGGVGSWTALFLAMSGVQELWLFDHDEISESNLNRVLFTKEDVGQRKVAATKELIKKYRPDCDVKACGKWLQSVVDAMQLYDRVTVVVAATDSVASRREIYRWTMIHSYRDIAYFEVGAEGEIGSVTDEPAEFSTERETQVGYASVPVWLGPAVSAALLVTSYVVHGRTQTDGAVVRMGWDGRKFGFYNSEESRNEQEEQVPAEVEDGIE